MRSIWCPDGRSTWTRNGNLYAQILLLLLCPRMAHRWPENYNEDEGINVKRHFTAKSEAVEAIRAAPFIKSS